MIGSFGQFELRYTFNDMQHRKVEFIRDHVAAGSVIFAPVWLLDCLDYYRPLTLREIDLLFRDRLEGRLERILSDPHVQHDRAERWKSELLDVGRECLSQPDPGADRPPP